MFGRLDLLKWFGDREKSFCKYTHNFLKLSGSKKQVPVRHTVNEDIMY